MNKHIIDNSCGDGAFLVEIVNRYCMHSLELGIPPEDTALDLGEFIHGIEIDENEWNKCLQNVNTVAEKYKVYNVKWDIICADTLKIYHKYEGKMDFVVGNPPYVRVHHLNTSLEDVKNFLFAKNGMTDLYIVFYEIGIKLLNEHGILGYITPNSFFNSLAGKYMRKYFIANNLLKKVVNLKHYQPFTTTTYTAITVLEKNQKTNELEYFEFDSSNQQPYYIAHLLPEDYYIAGNFYFSDKESLCYLKKILFHKEESNAFSVKNGFATLLDRFFIDEFDFSDYTIPIVKASTGQRSTCLFPYKNGNLIPYQKLIKNPSIQRRYEKFEKELKNRSLEKAEAWYGFGRTQGIHDVNCCKYSINALIKTLADVKIVKCKKGVGVYGGLYIITNLSEQQLKTLLISEDFISYISMLGKYKSGGYYTFSSKDLKIYLNYKNSQRRIQQNEQLTIFTNS